MYESRSPDTSIPIFLINHKLCSYSTGQNSQNSSKPHSSDIVRKPTNLHKPPDGKKGTPKHRERIAHNKSHLRDLNLRFIQKLCIEY